MNENTTAARKWTADTTNPPGKIQVSRFEKAMSTLRMEHNTRREKWGTIGGEEHEHCMTAIFGGGRRDDVSAVQLAIGEKYGWAVSKDNAAGIVADIEAALPALHASRPCDDKRKTPEQSAADKAQSLKWEQERAEKQRLESIEEERIAAAMRAKYPWALGVNSPLSGPARAAANLKLELGATFPGVRFSVKSERYSMGNSVDVSWDFGPTKEEVRKVSGKYQDGHFDGMTDSYEHDSSAFGGAVARVLGRSKYVSEHRACTFGGEQLTTLCRQVCELHGVDYAGPETGIDQYGQWGMKAAEVLSRIAEATSLPAGATVTGVERIPDKESGANLPQDWYRLTFDAGAVASAVEAQPEAGGTLGTVRRNLEHDGVEVSFPAKPAREVIDRLKASGFRWSMRSKVWYKKYSDYAWARACEIAGVEGENAEESRKNCGTPDDGAAGYVQAQEEAFQDRAAEVCGV